MAKDSEGKQGPRAAGMDKTLHERNAYYKQAHFQITRPDVDLEELMKMLESE